MEEERDYTKLLNDSISMAFSALQNFFKNIGLDYSLFSHVFDTQIKIDNTEDITKGDSAIYNPIDGKEDAIYIGIDYLDDIYNHLENGVSYNTALVNVADTIIHNLLHKLRIITLKEEVSLDNVSESMYKSAEMYHETYQKLKEYDDILVLSTLKNKKNLSRYIPIKVYIYRKNFYTFIAYNKRTKSYDVFEKKFFNSKFRGNYDEFMENLAIEASSKALFTPTVSYKSPLVNDHKYIIYNSMDLYTLQIKDKNKPLKNKQDIINRLNEIRSTIASQVTLEDAFTEVLSNMIILSRNKDYFDTEELISKISNNTDSIHEKCIAHLINTGGVELIKNFILAPYQDEFRNVFEEFYKDDYLTLLELFSSLDKDNYVIGNDINRLTEIRK